MAGSGMHNPENVAREGRTRPDPPGGGWQGGREDFETVWTLKGHKIPHTDLPSAEDIAKESRNHQRLYDAPGFCD